MMINNLYPHVKFLRDCNVTLKIRTSDDLPGQQCTTLPRQSNFLGSIRFVDVLNKLIEVNQLESRYVDVDVWCVSSIWIDSMHPSGRTQVEIVLSEHEPTHLENQHDQVRESEMVRAYVNQMKLDCDIKNKECQFSDEELKEIKTKARNKIEIWDW